MGDCDSTDDVTYGIEKDADHTNIQLPVTSQTPYPPKLSFSEDHFLPPTVLKEGTRQETWATLLS